MALARTNVTLSEELLREVDALAGPRGRSQFVADAVAAKVKRERLRKALDATRGIFVGTPSLHDARGVVPLDPLDARRGLRLTRYLLDTTVVIDHAQGYPPGIRSSGHCSKRHRSCYTCDVVTCEALSQR